MRTPKAVLLLAAGAAVVSLAACTGNPMPSPAPTATATVTVISRVTETALPSTTTTPSRGTRYYEVDDDDNPNFASPSGRIWCVIYTNSATCMTDFIDQDSLPKVRNCGESGWTGPPNVVLLAEGKATMVCFNDMAADPRRGSPYNTQWVEGYGEWVKVNLKGEQMELASLPYGKAMRAGTVACTSEDFGVSCVDRKTGHGFLIRNRGVVTF